jgi:class 3 adenylate cyclase
MSAYSRARRERPDRSGDCYVAATGVPIAKKDHATAMSRFARECMVAMHKIVDKLKASLRDDTAGLGMRFGLHSGPVMGGVLQGEKSRFQ